MCRLRRETLDSRQLNCVANSANSFPICLHLATLDCRDGLVVAAMSVLRRTASPAAQLPKIMSSGGSVNLCTSRTSHGLSPKKARLIYCRIDRRLPAFPTCCLGVLGGNSSIRLRPFRCLGPLLLWPPRTRGARRLSNFLPLARPGPSLE